MVRYKVTNLGSNKLKSIKLPKELNNLAELALENNLLESFDISQSELPQLNRLALSTEVDN